MEVRPLARAPGAGAGGGRWGARHPGLWLVCIPRVSLTRLPTPGLRLGPRALWKPSEG